MSGGALDHRQLEILFSFDSLFLLAENTRVPQYWPLVGESIEDFSSQFKLNFNALNLV